MVARAIMKQPKVMILEISKEWDTPRERRIKLKGELIKIELDGPEKTILVGVELTKKKMTRMTKLLR